MSKGGTQTSTTSIDPDLKKAFLNNIKQAQQVAGALPVQQFAEFNPMYQAGEQQLINTGLAGPGISSVDQAAALTQSAAGPRNLSLGTDAGSIGSYMNPYTKYVRENALADLETSRQNAIRQTAQQAGAAKAFGGSRQGVAEAQTNLGYGTQAGRLATQLNENAYNQAMAAQQADLMRQMTGAQQLSGIGGQQQALRMSGANAAMQAGAARQQLLQQQMDAQRNIGLQKLGVAQSALSQNIPNLGQSTSTPYSKNLAAGALGGAAYGYQIGGPWGAAYGGLLGML